MFKKLNSFPNSKKAGFNREAQLHPLKSGMIFDNNFFVEKIIAKFERQNLKKEVMNSEERYDLTVWAIGCGFIKVYKGR